MRLSFLLLLLPFLFVFCSGDDVRQDPYSSSASIPVPAATTRKYLALGDSYTIGESVYENDRFPAQLRDSLQHSEPELAVHVDYIARTGWTTTNLAMAIAAQQPSSDYDIVTLLIGVNNQYQHKPFSLYEQEFPQLLATSISLARGNKNHLIVVSIPDYAYTPYGVGTGNQESISSEIDQYNAFAKSYCEAQGVIFVNITDITREGLANTLLVASDGLHPSKYAYARFAQRLRAVAQPFL